MNRSRWSFTLPLVALLLVPSASPARAQDAPTGLRKDMIASLDDAGGKLVELAEAIPAAKYGYRPSKGVRSTAEVLLHVTAANYGLPMFMGVKPPPGSPVTAENFPTFEKSTTDKAKIVAMLRTSLENAKAAVAQTADADLDQPVQLFGAPNTKRGTLFILVNHAHEHLGQTIAYARSNNITPPWTAREQAAAAEKAKK